MLYTCLFMRILMKHMCKHCVEKFKLSAVWVALMSLGSGSLRLIKIPVFTATSALQLRTGLSHQSLHFYIFWRRFFFYCVKPFCPAKWHSVVQTSDAEHTDSLFTDGYFGEVYLQLIDLKVARSAFLRGMFWQVQIITFQLLRNHLNFTSVWCFLFTFHNA